MSPEEYQARIMVLNAAPSPPFRGRAKLIAWALAGADYSRMGWKAFLNDTGGPSPGWGNKRRGYIGADTCFSALRVLTMSPQERYFAALRGEINAKVLSFFKLHRDPAIESASSMRWHRSQRDTQITTRAQMMRRGMDPRDVYNIEYARTQAGPDPLTGRAQGEAFKRYVLHIFNQALERAQFRHVRYGHTDIVVFVPLGQEGATSEGGTFTWRVSPAILQVPEYQRSRKGLLVLSPRLSVAQGRGTQLVVTPIGTYIPRRRQRRGQPLEGQLKLFRNGR